MKAWIESFKSVSTDDFSKHGFLTPQQFVDSGD